MKKLSMVVMFACLPVVLYGCSKSTAQQRPNRAASKADPLEQDELAIQENAKRAKQDIDAITAEAEDALRRTRKNLTATATKHTSQISKQAHEVSDRAAEIAEDAKDRAEDMPEEVDRALDQRQSDLRARIRQRLADEERAVEQEESESSR